MTRMPSRHARAACSAPQLPRLIADSQRVEPEHRLVDARLRCGRPGRPVSLGSRHAGLGGKRGRAAEPVRSNWDPPFNCPARNEMKQTGIGKLGPQLLAIATSYSSMSLPRPPRAIQRYACSAGGAPGRPVAGLPEGVLDRTLLRRPPPCRHPWVCHYHRDARAVFVATGARLPRGFGRSLGLTWVSTSRQHCRGGAQRPRGRGTDSNSRMSYRSSGAAYISRLPDVEHFTAAGRWRAASADILPREGLDPLFEAGVDQRVVSRPTAVVRSRRLTAAVHGRSVRHRPCGACWSGASDRDRCTRATTSSKNHSDSAVWPGRPCKADCVVLPRYQRPGREVG